MINATTVILNFIFKIVYDFCTLSEISPLFILFSVRRSCTRTLFSQQHQLAILVISNLPTSWFVVPLMQVLSNYVIVYSEVNGLSTVSSFIAFSDYIKKNVYTPCEMHDKIKSILVLHNTYAIIWWQVISGY